MEGKEQKGNGNRFYQKLLFQLFMYFALVICMFAILLSVIYMKLYEKSTINTFRDDLAKKAERIAQNVSVYAREKDRTGFSAYFAATKSVFDQKETDIYILIQHLP